MSQHRRSRRPRQWPGRGKGGEAGTRRGERAHTGRANTEALPYSAGNSAQDPVTNHHGKESEKVCLTRSLGCATEMNTTQRCKRTPPESSCLKKKVSQQRSEHSHGYLPVGREAEPGVRRRCPREREGQRWRPRGRAGQGPKLGAWGRSWRGRALGGFQKGVPGAPLSSPAFPETRVERSVSHHSGRDLESQLR